MKLTPTVADLVERVPELAPGWAFFLDVDGTLLEIAEHPDAVQMPDGLVGILQALGRRADTPVALISGRTIADLDRLFAPLRLPAAGQHGAERRDATGRTLRSEAAGPLPDEVRDELKQFAKSHPGLLLEDKGSTLCVHYRQAPALGAEVESVVRAAAARLGEAYEVQPGKMVYEIRPASHDKGSAIADFLSEPPFAGRCPVFIGDDVTDEHGFQMVNQLGGHSIKVGKGATAATWRLSSVADVVNWLGDYVRKFGS